MLFPGAMRYTYRYHRSDNLRRKIVAAAGRVESFIARWERIDAAERSVSQTHFIDVCRLIGHPAPYDAQPEKFRLLQDLFYAPHRLDPNLRSEKVTQEAAAAFAAIAAHLERTKTTASPERLARFLMQMVFSMFAEDVRMGTSLEDRPRYTPTSTFETFPLPFPPGKEDPADPRVIAIAAAAKALHEERHAWLHDPASHEGRDRTLTNLYNARAALHGAPQKGIKPAAAFAPRLEALHAALDRAVCAAYGWDPAVLDDEEALLSALLALNAARAG